MRANIWMRLSAVTSLALFLFGAVDVTAVMIETAVVGDEGNAADAATGSLYGSVGYKYKIGKYEVTNGQYAEFLNAVAASDPYGLYNTNMFTSTSAGGIERSGVDGSYTYAAVSGRENWPVNFVVFSNMLHFANWLTNGQGGPGTTHDGAYDLSEAIDEVTRSNLRPAWFIASEDEWYKAAYYDPTLNSGAGGYWTYGTRNNTQPTASSPPGTGNNSNWNNHVKRPTDVGAYTGSVSYYGLHDLAGNLSEVLDTIYIGSSADNRVRRGQHYYTTSTSLLPSSGRTLDGLTVGAVRNVGFRVVQILRSGTMVRVQ